MFLLVVVVCVLCVCIIELLYIYIMCFWSTWQSACNARERNSEAPLSDQCPRDDPGVFQGETDLPQACLEYGDVHPELTQIGVFNCLRCLVSV